MLFKDHVYHFQPVELNSAVNRVLTDLTYAPGKRHRLDIYWPAGSGLFPVIIDLYGGGLLRGEKSSYKLHPSLEFVKAGYVVISPNYSINTDQQVTFPNQIAEIRAVYDFCLDQGKQYHLDTNRISLIGESSGAQLAVLAAASFSTRAAIGHIDGYHSRYEHPKIHRVIGLYGPYQLDSFVTEFNQLGILPKFSETGTAESFEGIALGRQTPSKVPERVALANPANYFTRAMPPLMLIAGTADHVVPYQQSVALADTYQRLVGESATTLWKTGADHGIRDFDNPTVYQAKLKFLQ